MSPVDIDACFPSTRFPCAASQRADKTELAHRVLSSRFWNPILAAGFLRETLSVRSLEIGTADSHAHSVYGPAGFGSLHISRPSLIPVDLMDRLRDFPSPQARFEIGLCAAAELGTSGFVRLPPQREVDWRAPDVWSPRFHTAGHQTQDGVWELRFGREPRAEVRKEIDSLPENIWGALDIAREEIERALSAQARTTQPGAGRAFAALAAPFRGARGLFGGR